MEKEGGESPYSCNQRGTTAVGQCSSLDVGNVGEPTAEHANICMRMERRGGDRARATDARTWKHTRRWKKTTYIEQGKERMNRRDGRRRTQSNGSGYMIKTSRQTPPRRKETSTGNRQLKEGYVKGEKRTEQGDEDEDRVQR